MKVYSADKIRNVSLLGHSNSGKTSLTEAALYVSGAIKRQGRVEDGNTVSDFGKEEIARAVSIGASVIPVEWSGKKINFIDTPGYFDFIGEMYGAKRASEGSILMVDASSGIEVGTEKGWKNLEKYNTPRLIFLNKMDKEEINFDKLLEDLKTKFSEKIIPISLPLYDKDGNFEGLIDLLDKKAYTYESGKSKEVEIDPELVDKVEEGHTALMEKIAETDEELLNKYFGGEEFTEADRRKGLLLAVENGDLAPVFVGSTEQAIGIDFLLDNIDRYIPSPARVKVSVGEYNGEVVERKFTEDEPFSAVVFKTIIDPFIGKISLFQVLSGVMTKDMDLYNSTQEEDEKLGGIFIMRGKEQIEVPEIKAGDIGATVKLNHTVTGDTLCDKKNPIVYETIKYPKATYFQSVVAKSKGDEDKIGSSLRKLMEEDPTFVVERNRETKELLVGGQGNQQLSIVVDKLKNAFGVEVELHEPKIAFRETIKGKSDVQGRHKKQSGGAGQYGDVMIRFEPSDEHFVFEEEVFGGAVPRNYFPAVEKGLEESMEEGVLAGYPVTNIKAILYDGSYHPVDSNEMAFKIAASLAFKKGMEEASPILLEPIMSVTINIPDEYLGDIMGDMNKRRGRILGMDQQADGSQLVTAEAPHAEMFNYAIDLRAMTQARGSFQMEFIRYEEVPSNIAEKIIEEAKNK